MYGSTHHFSKQTVPFFLSRKYRAPITISTNIRPVERGHMQAPRFIRKAWRSSWNLFGGSSQLRNLVRGKAGGWALHLIRNVSTGPERVRSG